MARLVVSENMTLDGVVQDPTGEEGTPGGGWFAAMADTDREAWGKLEFDEASRSEAMLLGRGTYEYFAARWPSRTGAWADRLNCMPKYVVSSTLANPKWCNTTVLGGDALEAVGGLKNQLVGDIVLYGSNQLVAPLLEHHLVDELRLMVYPALAGSGARLFGAMNRKMSLRLIGTQRVGDGLTLLTYGT